MTQEVDYDWVKAQFEKAKLRVASGEAILQLLEKWQEVELPEGLVAETLRAFADLAAGNALVPENADEAWAQAIPGSIRVGDEVRVKHDAFPLNRGGTMHNGRRGKVLAVRSGDVIFRSTDGVQPFLDGTHYPPAKLEKRIR